VEIISKEYKSCFTNRRYITSLVVGFVFLGVAFVVNYYASVYATDSASNYVNDIILSNIRVFDVDQIFVFGPFVFWAFVAIFCFHRPQRIPFVAKNIALFIIIRAGFVTLTHIGPFPTQVPINYKSDWIWWLSQGGDLFFSAHTGLPYLMALVFGVINKWFFYAFTAAAVFFGVVVLLGHLHYSIDVAAAFFITYSIYHIAIRWFKKDKEMFEKGLPTPPAN
jgi:hypothetical protein